MKFFLDTEFHEYHKDQIFGKSIPTIDLISIGIVSESTTEQRSSDKLSEPKSILHLGREYYAICKDFNLKNAWNSFQIDSYDRMGNLYSEPKKVYWLRDNVLKPIYDELVNKHLDRNLTMEEFSTFTMKNLKSLLSIFGKTREQIAGEIKGFVTRDTHISISTGKLRTNTTHEDIEFYAYYADYDWVVFAQLFGKMMDLPTGFPMYCNDLKQTLDEKYKFNSHTPDCNPNYPKQENEHNALDDAKWNKKLYEFLQKL